jgi:hypothetical protein
MRTTWAIILASIILVILVLTPQAVTLQIRKQKIFIFHNGDDAIGNAVAFYLKEDIDRSTRYSLIQESGLQDAADFTIELASLDIDQAVLPGGTTKGRMSALSYIFTVNTLAPDGKAPCGEHAWVPLTRTSQMIVGSQASQDVALKILIKLDKLLHFE